MRVEKVNRDHRYTSRQRLLMLLLLCASAVAALVASKQIPLTPSLDMQAPRALEVIVALLAAAVAAPPISGSRDPVKRHLELTLNWDSGYEPYIRYNGSDKLLDVVRGSTSDPGLTICVTAQPVRARGILLRASALRGAIPLFIPVGELEAPDLSIDKVWARRLSKRDTSFPMPRPYRLFVIVGCQDRNIGPDQLLALDHWQRTWPTSSVVVLVRPGHFTAPADPDLRIRTVELGDTAWAMSPVDDRIGQMSATLKASDAPRSTRDIGMFMAALGIAEPDLLAAPLRTQGQRIAWLAGIRAAIRIAPVYAVLSAGIAVILGVHSGVPVGPLIGIALLGLLTGPLVAVAVLALMCGVSLGVSRTVRPVSSRLARVGTATAAGVAACLFLQDVLGLADRTNLLGLGLSCAALAYARMTQLAHGDSVAAVADRYRQELLCAAALMVTWEIVSYQTSYADAASWTLVVGTIGFWMRRSARRRNRSAMSACAAALLLVVGLSGLLGLGSLLQGTEYRYGGAQLGFITSYPAIAVQQLAIVASFMLLAAVISLTYCRGNPDSISTLTRWTAVTVSIAVAQPLFALTEQLPGQAAEFNFSRGTVYQEFDPFSTDALSLALTGGILLGLVLVLMPRIIGWRARESVCALALAVAATASIVPSGMASDQFIALTIANSFTRNYSSAPYIYLVLMLSLGLTLSMQRQNLLTWIRSLGRSALIYLVLSAAALAGLFFYTEAQFDNQLAPATAHMPSIFHLLLGSVRQFGPAAVVVLLSFLLSMLGAALIRRFRARVDRGYLIARRHLVPSLFILTFFISLQQSQLLLSFEAPLQFSWLTLLLAFASAISALILWHLLRRRYGAGNVSGLATAVAALGLFLFGSTTMVVLGALMIVLGGPLESLYRSFRLPDRTSLAFGFYIGITALFLLWAFNQRDIQTAAFPALLLGVATALVHPVDAGQLPNSILRGNQVRLRQVIYWSAAITSPYFLVSFGVFDTDFGLGTGWQGTVASTAEFLFGLLLLGSIGCAWIAAAWWAAGTPAGVTWQGGLRKSEDAYGRYYATAGEIGGSAYPGVTPKPVTTGGTITT